MLLGIISDTHDRLRRTTRAMELLKEHGAEAIVHCGDLTGPEIVTACAVMPSWFVFGNNDADAIPDLERAMNRVGAVCLQWGGEITLEEKRIAVTHGHMHTDVRRLLSTAPDYLLFGHSHIPTDNRQGATRRINPGALHRAAEFTVAILDLETDDLQFLNVPRRVE